MDDSERLVERYLTSCGYKDVRYEPDGNRPPDFLVDGVIAIEVRRLNQNYNDGFCSKGLEEVAIPLWKSVRKLLLSLGPPTSGQSWFVYYEFSRPLPDWKYLRQELELVLKRFMVQTEPTMLNLSICNGFNVIFLKAGDPHPTSFVPGGHGDDQSGGWLISEIKTNLNLCIQEKGRKIAKLTAKYPEWWLILPDHIGYGLNDFDQSLFFDEAPVLPGIFNRVILLDPRDHARSFNALGR
jgi:hypothetical protein